MNIAIIGGGAAGVFCSIQLKTFLPQSAVTIYEAGNKPLAKVAITGGGRCNLTNSFKNISNLKNAYPRGEQLIKRAFKTFSPQQTYNYFEKELGVSLVTQEDECVFPRSQNAMEIVNALINKAMSLGVQIETNHRVSSVQLAGGNGKITESKHNSHKYLISFHSSHKDRKINSVSADYVIVTTGGAPKTEFLNFLKELDIKIIPSTPSLFTLNLNESNPFSSLQGIVVKNVTLSIPGTNFKSHDTLLITHWGISGPATLKLSSYASRYLAENQYNAPLQIRWMEEKQIEEFISYNILHSPSRQIQNTHPQSIPKRLWSYILSNASLREEITWKEIKKKGVNKLVQIILNDSYRISSKGEYKEEFVTCGGVSLSEIDLYTLESKRYKGVYFAGEVLDIDAITGGFNLQAAWSCAYSVAAAIHKSFYSCTTQ